MGIGWPSLHFERPWLWSKRNRRVSWLRWSPAPPPAILGPRTCSSLSLAMLRSALRWWTSLWWPPEAVTFDDSDGPFEEVTCLKLGLHSPDLHAKGKRSSNCFFYCLAVETLVEKALIKHHLEQPGLATRLHQTTRSKAKHRIKDLTKFSGRGLETQSFEKPLL